MIVGVSSISSCGEDHSILICFFFFSSRRRHTRSKRAWSSDVCSSDLNGEFHVQFEKAEISRGYIADQGCDYGFAIPIRGQQLGPRRFRRSTQPAPDVDLEGEKVEKH